MNFKVKKICFLLFCSIGLTLSAQNVKTIKPVVNVTYAKKIGTTAPLKDLVPRQATNQAKKKADKALIRPPKNFVGRRHSRVVNEKMEHTGPDKLRQSYVRRSLSSVVEPLVNVVGLTSGRPPNDPSGDAGLNYYVQAINDTRFGIFNKADGSLITNFAGNTLWNSLGFTSAGDPIVIYDQEVNRWILTEFADQGNNLLVAVSESGDPMGSYDVYSFNTPNFPDYPKYSVWRDVYTLTTNERSGRFLHSYFINKEDLLNGADAVRIQRVEMPGNDNSESGFYVATPVDWSGFVAPPENRDPMFLALNDASWNAGETQDKIEVFSVDVDWDNEANTVLMQQSIVVSPYDSYPCSSGGGRFSCIPQKDGIGLDGLPEVIMNQIHYRNFGSYETMVLCFITDVTDGENVSGIRWVELRRNSTDPWSVYQEGTFAPDDNLHRYMCSIAMDGSGNIGLAYNASSPDDFIGVRYTGRRNSDPLGEMTVEEYELAAGESVVNNPIDPSRFGDYAHMTIDPSDDATFWFTTEYAGPNNVATRIAAFIMKKDTFDIGPLALKTPINGSLLTNMEEVELSIQNFGIDTIRNFEVGYILEGEAEVKEVVSTELFPDSIYNHTFLSTVDVSMIGDYNIKLFTSLDVDQNILNDTVNSIIRNLPQIDLAIPGITELGFVCAESVALEVDLLNLGTSEITEAVFDVVLNGTPIGEQMLVSSLSSNESTILVINLSGLLNGQNTVDINLISANGINGDENDVNNSFSTSFEAVTNGMLANVAITTDNFPEETSWEVTNENGLIIAQGGPYEGMEFEVINQEICIDPEQCYTFTIYDSYGDGLFNENGGYVVTNEDGAILSQIMTPDFGDSEANDFCAEFICAVEATARVGLASSPKNNDGFILVEVINGVGPFEYSIDDGATFQGSNGFSDLERGEYQITVKGSGDCLFIFTVNVLACEIDAAFIVTPESDFGSSDGGIDIQINGNVGATLISINGGATLGVETNYQGLVADDYEVIIRDSLGCEYNETVHVGNSVSSDDIVIGSVVKIYPNPTDGVFQIELIGISSNEIFIPISLYTTEGKVIQRSKLAKYDNGYLGLMSLYHYPAGLYYLKVEDPNSNKLIRVFKK